ncbi:MAG TPA: DUF3034 family protein [Caulobacteraceae bacterium]|nr:DUF3034 family protein [Caulobacteraceae bacterium]
MSKIAWPLLLAIALLLWRPAQAEEWQWGGKLKLTRGVTDIEGSAGGGLASWAVIAGNETRNGIGAEASATYVQLPDYAFRSYGGAVGLFDRAEVSYAHQQFDTGATGAKLGLGRGFVFDEDVIGAKLRLVGDAVYDQDSWLPQVAAGVQYKHNDQGAVIHAIGGKDDSGVDYYLAATKILLDHSLVLDATVRATRANQTGILGFGGDRNSGYRAEFEGSAGYLLTKQLLVGAEYRTKPDNLGIAKESDWGDLFAAYAVNEHLSVTAAYADLGDIVTFRRQRGVYLSLQAGF